MKKNKLFSQLFITSLLSLAFLTSCNLSTSSSGISSDSVNIDSSSKTSWHDIYKLPVIGDEFYIGETKYVYAKDTLSKENIEIYKFIGYLVNECDLEKWKEYDNNDNYIYAYDKNNNLQSNCAYDVSEYDRFRMYSINNLEEIGVLTQACLLLYKMV